MTTSRWEFLFCLFLISSRISNSARSTLFFVSSSSVLFVYLRSCGKRAIDARTWSARPPIRTRLNTLLVCVCVCENNRCVLYDCQSSQSRVPWAEWKRKKTFLFYFFSLFFGSFYIYYKYHFLLLLLLFIRSRHLFVWLVARYEKRQQQQRE